MNARKLIAAINAIKKVLPEKYGRAHEHLDDFLNDIGTNTEFLSPLKIDDLSAYRIRLRGFIRGLCDAGALDFCDWHELDILLIEATV